MPNQTLSYYNENAQIFVEGTVQADMSTVRNHFLSLIPPTGHILDAGCGSGRDSKAFLEAGYQVAAMDGSEALCQKASTLIGQPVQHRYFQQVDEGGVYDGIWACVADQVTVIATDLTVDVRPDRKERWLNIIIKKN